MDVARKMEICGIVRFMEQVLFGMSFSKKAEHETRTWGGYFGKGLKELEHGAWKSETEKEVKPNQGATLTLLGAL